MLPLKKPGKKEHRRWISPARLDDESSTSKDEVSGNVLGNREHLRDRAKIAHWAWEEERPFALVQVDVKDILDKGTLGTKLWDHLAKKKLPRYQWTRLSGRTRLRNLTNGLCFMSLVMRKEHNGRMERSHRTDDEEFYIPFLGKVQTEEDFLRKAVSWVYYYALVRP